MSKMWGEETSWLDKSKNQTFHLLLSSGTQYAHMCNAGLRGEGRQVWETGYSKEEEPTTPRYRHKLHDTQRPLARQLLMRQLNECKWEWHRPGTAIHERSRRAGCDGQLQQWTLEFVALSSRTVTVTWPSRKKKNDLPGEDLRWNYSLLRHMNLNSTHFILWNMELFSLENE